MCRLSDMDDFYHFDEKTLTVTGERKNKKYRMGDRVLIKVINASKEERTIDFKIIKKIEEEVVDEEEIEII